LFDRAFNENLLAITIFTDLEDTAIKIKTTTTKRPIIAQTNAHILSEQLRERERRNERELSCQVILIETLYINIVRIRRLRLARMLFLYWIILQHSQSFNVIRPNDYDDGFKTLERVPIIREISSQR
jgi:hypothetical protein